MRRDASSPTPRAHTAADGEKRPFVSVFTAGAIGCNIVRYTSAFAQCADARDTREVTYSVRLPLDGAAHATHGTHTGMRGLLVMGT